MNEFLLGNRSTPTSRFAMKRPGSARLRPSRFQHCSSGGASPSRHLLKPKFVSRHFVAFLLAASVFVNDSLLAQVETGRLSAPQVRVLKKAQWKQVDDSVKRGLAWLLSQQKEDGAFETIELGQPGVTSFCLMAFLAQGESPADGKYQQQLAAAVDFIADQQKRNGLIAASAPNTATVPRYAARAVGSSSVYNHAISALALCEVYGQCKPEQTQRLTPVIEKAIAATLEMQQWGPKHEEDVGGWRYLDLRNRNEDSDLSIAGWHLTFLRSAKNAGFEVPDESIDAAVKYVENCFNKNRQVHAYIGRRRDACTRAMAGAGVLALAHAGKYGSKQTLASGEWILKHDFKNYNDDRPIYGAVQSEEQYHYACFLCTQAMFQLGGKFWEQFFPPLVDTLLANQQPDGAWPPETAEPQFGNCYSTSLCVLSLSVPNQILPIFQR